MRDELHYLRGEKKQKDRQRVDDGRGTNPLFLL